MGKAAIERLTQLLAVELGRHDIRVNSVGPTYVMTPPLRAKVEAGQRDLNKIMAVHALTRLPEPADIADAIAFLCSDQASHHRHPAADRCRLAGGGELPHLRRRCAVEGVSRNSLHRSSVCCDIRNSHTVKTAVEDHSPEQYAPRTSLFLRRPGPFPYGVRTALGWIRISPSSAHG